MQSVFYTTADLQTFKPDCFDFEMTIFCYIIYTVFVNFCFTAVNLFKVYYFAVVFMTELFCNHFIFYIYCTLWIESVLRISL